MNNINYDNIIMEVSYIQKLYKIQSMVKAKVLLNNKKIHKRNPLLDPQSYKKGQSNLGQEPAPGRPILHHYRAPRIKKIPDQAPPTQLGPRKCTF